MVEAVGRGMSSTLEEVQMQGALLFSDTIKDLKTLKSQLYSAAEYFELAYMQDDAKQTVMSNLKEYAVKALVNTVDHLGSISFKVSSLVDQSFKEVSDTSLRLSCIHERTQISQACMDRERFSQQSLVITAPMYHKRYTLPVGYESIPCAVPNFREMNKATNRAAQMHQVLSAAVQPKAREKESSFSKLRSISRAPSQRARSASPAPAQRSRSVPPSKTAIPSNKDKRSDSPVPSATRLTRSASINSKKPSLLNTLSVRVQTATQPKKLAPLRSQADRSNDTKDGEHTPKKSRKFLKSLLSRQVQKR